MSLPFAIERSDQKVLTVRMDDIRAGWHQWILLRSDAHHDHIDCEVELEKKHLDQALERNALILDLGDLFDVMSTRKDERGDKSHLPEPIRMSAKPYMNAVLDYVGEFYEPYAANWGMLSPGNHETKHKDFDLTQLLGERLRAKGSPLEVMPYEGWVRFMFRWNGTKQKSYRLWYTHGYGGGGAATKGVGQNHRQLAFLGNVDFLVNGHVHNQYWVTDAKESLDVNGKVVENRVECLRTPGYKNEKRTGNGFSPEKGHHLKVRGAWWLYFFCEEDQIQYEVRQAK